jgi:hypothetical protein
MTNAGQLDNTLPAVPETRATMKENSTRPMWLWGVGFGVVGIMLLLERVGALAAAAMPNPSLYVARGLPVPTAVMWQHPLSHALYWLRDQLPYWTTLWWILLVASPFLMFLTFQRRASFFESTDPSDELTDQPLQRRLDLRAIGRVLVLSLISLWLMGGLWWGYRTLYPPPLPDSSASAETLRRLTPQQETVLGGIYFWAGTILPQNEQSVRWRSAVICLVWLIGSGLALFALWQGSLLRPRRLMSAALRGLVAGTLSVSVLYVLFFPGHSLLTLAMASVATSGEKLWHQWFIGFVVIGIIGFVSLGIAIYLLARPELLRLESRRFVPLSMGTLCLIAALQWGLYTRVVKKRWDFGKDFITAVIGKSPSRAQQRQGRTLLALGDNHFVTLSPSLTFMGAENTPRTKEKVWSYLRQRHYRSAVAREAFLHLHNCASLDWDSVASLEVAFTNVERCPTTAMGNRTFVELILDKLSSCPITPETRRYVVKLADERILQHPTPMTCRTVADLLWKFGEKQKAEEWFRRAGMSAQEAKKIVTTHTDRLSNGVVKGALIVDGKPAVGWRVGLIPWGNYERMRGFRAPFMQRFIVMGVKTDEQGRFHFENLARGEYALVVAQSPNVLPPNPNAIIVKNLPGKTTLTLENPTRDMGKIEIKINKNAPPPPRPTPPTPNGGNAEEGDVVT